MFGKSEPFMDLNNLTAISPVDGRYRDKTKVLSNYFSEYGLIRYRVLVEIEYFIAISKLGLKGLEKIDDETAGKLRDVYLNFTVSDAERVKAFEKTTNHDVKAVEYFLKEVFDELGVSSRKEFIHFGLTSQDINNTATPLSLKEAVNDAYLPMILKLLRRLDERSEEWKDIPMLARTHGQPASPTRLGKEIKVFTERLDIQLRQLRALSFPAKFGGATGNFNAHHVAYPGVDWVDFANRFVNDHLGLKRSLTTTQIEHYDNLAAIFDNLARINTILIDFSRDIWMYISMEYFRQRILEGEVGSSTMPHNVNPIDVENAEGNLGVANAILHHLSSKLPLSRLQRDLTDSTVLRNVGVPLGHMLIAVQSLLKGLDKLIINMEQIENDLERNWAVVAEAIQTILRREGFPKPYEALKALTRTHDSIDKQTIAAFVDSLDIDDQVKEELKQITPKNYTGI